MDGYQLKNDLIGSRLKKRPLEVEDQNAPADNTGKVREPVDLPLGFSVAIHFADPRLAGITAGGLNGKVDMTLRATLDKEFFLRFIAGLGLEHSHFFSPKNQDASLFL
ncbi:MAG: hypothetical protein R6T92_06640 [Desulfosalsimonadaceae bacterium]